MRTECPICSGINTSCGVNSSIRDNNGVWRCDVICWDCKNADGHNGLIVFEQRPCSSSTINSTDHIGDASPIKTHLKH
jgi:hypothetical protein